MWSGPSAKERRRDGKQSPAYQIISLFHANEGYQQGRSNIRTDHAHQAILADCIRFGIRFDLDDFEVINGASEWEYRLACGDERGISNPSAAHALEKHFGRQPFLIEDEGNSTPTRVYVGRRFKWLGKDVTCTSFAKDQQSFTACSYKPQPEGSYSREVEKRFCITHADIKLQRADRKEREPLVSKIRELVKTADKELLEKLSVKYPGNPSAMPLIQLRHIEKLLTPVPL